jgi:hypothetical protein
LSAFIRHGKTFWIRASKLESNRGKIKPNLNSAEPQSLSLQSCKERFETYIDQTLGCAWHDTEQVKTLLVICNPNNRNGFVGKLEHMRLDPRPNEFMEAKQAGLILAKYISKT